MTTVERSVTFSAGRAVLAADLVVPAAPAGMVLFAHGSGSSRKSPRNRAVAGVLHEAGLGTLLVDLLTREEERADLAGADYRFDIQLLARRLVAATEWVIGQRDLASLPIGYFGASTGAAAALIAAAERPAVVRAVVSRGGRPDLADTALAAVRTPTLLIVGGEDDIVIDLNRAAQARMHGEVKLEIVPGATHLFEEPGALEAVAALARAWFERHLSRRHAAA